MLIVDSLLQFKYESSVVLSSIMDKSTCLRVNKESYHVFILDKIMFWQSSCCHLLMVGLGGLGACLEIQDSRVKTQLRSMDFFRT